MKLKFNIYLFLFVYEIIGNILEWNGNILEWNVEWICFFLNLGNGLLNFFFEVFEVFIGNIVFGCD